MYLATIKNLVLGLLKILRASQHPQVVLSLRERKEACCQNGEVAKEEQECPSA